MKPNEQEKLNKIRELISKIPKINILELGVQSGNSTRMFIDICEKNDGYLTSIDIDDCSKVIKNSRWTFIHSSDDNFEYVNKFLKNNFDVLFIDSLHEPDHVKKILSVSLYARKNNSLLSKKIETDILLRFAITTQISSAIEIAGQKPNKDFLIIDYQIVLFLN